MKTSPRADGRRLPKSSLAGLIAIIRTIAGAKSDSARAQRTALLTFGVRVFGAALAYFLQVFLARWMGGHEYGIFVLVWTMVVVLGVVAPLGFNSVVQRLIPEYKSLAQPDLLRGILTASRVYGVASATFLAALGAFLVWLLSDHIPAYYVVPVYLAALSLPMFTLTDVQEGMARAGDWVDLAMLPIYIWRPLLILLGALGAGFMGFEHTAITIGCVAVAATWIVALTQMRAIDRRFRRIVPAGPQLWKTVAWLRLSLPIFLIEGFFALLTSSDVLMVGYFETPERVAIYYAAAKTLALVHFVYFAVKAASAHRYSRLYHSGDRAGLEAYVHDSVRWTFWPSLACAGLLFVFGSYILAMFGEAFTQGHDILAILMIGVLARAAVGPVDALLTMANEQNRCAMAYAAAFVVNITLNLTFIPIYGLTGAAIATALSMCFEAAMLFTIARRQLGIHSFIWCTSARANAAREDAAETEGETVS